MQVACGLCEPRRSSALICVAIVLFFAVVPSFAQSELPLPSPLPNDSLTFFKNYFVTGDYVVRGVTLRGTGTAGFATKPIKPNPDGTDAVPANANIVAAFLYWITVESTPTPSARNGTFQGYKIQGVALPNVANKSTDSTPPCWSSGGGTGTSDGSKNSRVYRADVRPYMVSAGTFDPNADFTVSLPDSGSGGAGTPLTLGASLVIIYRNTSSPLKAVTLYDGAWTMNNAARYMFLRLANFYDASSNGTAQGRLTNIASNGQSNFVEQMQFYTNDATGNLVTTPTSKVTNPFSSLSGWGQSPPVQPVTLTNGAPRAALYVAPTASNTDCINWGAVVLSTPVEDGDSDGLLNSWEQNSGYWYPDNQTATTRAPDAQWTALEDAHVGSPDVYVQFDSLKTNATTLGGVSVPEHSHLPKYSALQMIGKAFSDAGISAHFDVGANQSGYTGQPYIISSANSRAQSFDESDVNCTDRAATSTSPASLCLYPPSTGIPGIIGWKAGLNWLKNYSWGTTLRGRKDSFHYVLMAHALGFPSQNWSAVDGTLKNVVVTGSNATVSVTGTVLPAVDTRVSISGVVSDFRLNGTYKVLSSPAPANGKFTLGLLGPVTPGTYSLTTQLLGVNGSSFNEPSLVVSTGLPKTTSGFSDLGGGDSLITLGLWRSDNPADNQVGTALVQAGTIMHEIGHTFVLTHGGYYPDTNLLGTNCKPNYQSVMSYLFQIRGIPSLAGPIVDYSGETLSPNLDENVLVESQGVGGAGQRGTRWYGPATYLDKTINLQTRGARYPSTHCDGTQRPTTDEIVRLETPSTALGVDWNQDKLIPSSPTDSLDINYNGFADTLNVPYIDASGATQHIDLPMRGYDDWHSLMLTQVGARPNAAGYSTDISGSQILGGGSQILGGGSQILGGGSQILGGGSEIVAGGSQILGGGSQILGGGSQILGGGSQILGGGSQILGGGAELDFERANTTVDPPTGLAPTAITKGVTLNWSAPSFGLIRTYYIFKTDITKAAMSPTNLPVLVQILSTSCGTITATAPCSALDTKWTDYNIKNSGVYQYFVTAALGSDSGSNAGNGSGPSNIVTFP